MNPHAPIIGLLTCEALVLYALLWSRMDPLESRLFVRLWDSWEEVFGRKEGSMACFLILHVLLTLALPLGLIVMICFHCAFA